MPNTPTMQHSQATRTAGVGLRGFGDRAQRRVAVPQRERQQAAVDQRAHRIAQRRQVGGPEAAETCIEAGERRRVRRRRGRLGWRAWKRAPMSDHTPGLVSMGLTAKPPALIL